MSEQQPPTQPPSSSSLPPEQQQQPASTEPAPASTSTPEPKSESVTVKEEPDATSAAALDASLEKEDIDMGGTGGGDNTAPQASGSSTIPAVDGPGDVPTGGAGGGQTQASTEINPVAPAPALTKKDASLREFLGKMDEYAPIIPDAVTAHYLTLAGLPPPGHGPNSTPPHLARLLALATQKFVADIAADAYQYSRIRSSNSSSGNNPMGGLNVASGLAVPNQTAGLGGGQGAPGAAGGGEGSKGKGAAGGAHLGVQRAGFGGGGQGGSGQGRTVLTMEDLGMAVSEYGVSVKRGEFYR
ncbi:hypothetical protein FQN54_006199 [Arachnomyces sp. PD_36]|nr:hypothetical protein FQN54_006199 [Arachnomyces sp. PD_36]